MSFTLDELKDALADYDDDTFFEKIEYTKENPVHSWESECIELPDIGKAVYVEGYTGGEGGGSDAYIVFRIGDRLFRKHGYYASHYGTDWDGSLEEVEAFEKTVTDYRRV